MTNDSDRDYYAKRVRYERALAKSATDGASKRAHADMAAHYEKLLSGGPAAYPDTTGEDRLFNY